MLKGWFCRQGAGVKLAVEGFHQSGRTRISFNQFHTLTLHALHFSSITVFRGGDSCGPKAAPATSTGTTLAAKLFTLLVWVPAAALRAAQ